MPLILWNIEDPNNPSIQELIGAKDIDSRNRSHRGKEGPIELHLNDVYTNISNFLDLLAMSCLFIILQ